MSVTIRFWFVPDSAQISRGHRVAGLCWSVPASEYQRMRAPFSRATFPAPVKYGYACVGEIEGRLRAPPWQNRFLLAPAPGYALWFRADAVVRVPEFGAGESGHPGSDNGKPRYKRSVGIPLPGPAIAQRCQGGGWSVQWLPWLVRRPARHGSHPELIYGLSAPSGIKSGGEDFALARPGR